MEKSVINSLSLQGAYPRKPGERLPSALRVWPRASAGIRTANLIFAGGTAGVSVRLEPAGPAVNLTPMKAAGPFDG